KVYESDEGTVSSFSIDDGQVTGYFLERPAGTDAEERTGGSRKRIPAGNYNITYPHPLSAREGKDGESLVRTDLVPGNGRNGILIHRGNFPWDSTGCLLAGDSYDPGYILQTQKISNIYDTVYPVGYETIYLNGWGTSCQDSMTGKIAKYIDDLRAE